MTKSKPSVVIGVIPGSGHFNPSRVVAKGLIAREYKVTIITTAHFCEKVEDIPRRTLCSNGR
jgi:UDP:flavonoid glycosyltransferase YjiC (YdhE family)